MSNPNNNMNAYKQALIINRKLKKELEQIYEALVGDNGMERYTHAEIIDWIYQLVEKDEPIVGQWQDYMSSEERVYSDDKLSDGEVLDLVYDYCEAQVMKHPILEGIITILKENE
jgi:hypothetical protein